jgi:dUTPase
LTFKTIRQDEHDGLLRTNNYVIHFSPAPPRESLPAVWLDLHVDGATFQVCGDDVPRPLTESNGGKAIKVKPYQSVRVRTKERVGVNDQHTAFVSNVRSMAIRGLVLAPGKIDPGFSPNPLVLVIHNQTSRAQLIKIGEKVAAVAFAVVDPPAVSSNAGPAVPEDKFDYAPTLRQRSALWFRDQISPNVGSALLRMLGQALACLIRDSADFWLADVA